MCSRFRGSCPSDVKSAGHPESGFPISLSVFAAALCAPREIQKNPAARSVPGYRPRFQALSSWHTQPPGRTTRVLRGFVLFCVIRSKIRPMRFGPTRFAAGSPKALPLSSPPYVTISLVLYLILITYAIINEVKGLQNLAFTKVGAGCCKGNPGWAGRR